jgi:uncharacterized membrane protein
MNYTLVKNCIFGLAIFSAVFFYAKSCQQPLVIELPANVIQSVKETIVLDSTRTRQVTDSMQRIVDARNSTIASQEKTIYKERELRKDVIQDLKEATAGCKDSTLMRQQIDNLVQHNKTIDSSYAEQTKRYDSNQVEFKKIISEKDLLYSRVRRGFDTCETNYNTLYKYSVQQDKKLVNVTKGRNNWRNTTLGVVAVAIAHSLLK